MSRQRVLVLRLGAAAVLATTALTGCATARGAGAPVAVASSPASTFAGLELSTTYRLPDVGLLDTAGKPFDPAQHDDHAVTLAFTGYTHCTDVCPTTMADIAAALRDLPPPVARQVQVEFVTTDPYQDSPQVIRRWLDRFDPAFVGLWGTRAQVSRLSSDLGLPLPEDQGRTHSTVVLGFVRGRGADVAWVSGFTPADLVHDLPLLVAQAR